MKHLARCCTLEANDGIFSPQMIERFAELSRDETCEMKLLSNEGDANATIHRTIVCGWSVL